MDRTDDSHDGVRRMNQRGFVIPSFLLSPTGIMGVAIVMLSISNVVLFKLWKGAVNEYATYVAEVDAAQKRIADENARRIAEAEAATKDVSIAWDRAANDLRADYVSRLRTQERRCAALSGTAATARRTNAATADTGSGPAAPTPFESACIKLEADCAHTTGQLIWLQDYTRRVCK